VVDYISTFLNIIKLLDECGGELDPERLNMD
jgi:hypothetical protein